MARRTGLSARAQALAKAAEAVARRDVERIARERSIQASLAEFFQAQAHVDRIHAEADRTAAPFEAAIRDAVRTLDRLGESRTGIAALTGLSMARVRDYVTYDPELTRRGHSADSAHPTVRESKENSGSSEPTWATTAGDQQLPPAITHGYPSNPTTTPSEEANSES